MSEQDLTPEDAKQLLELKTLAAATDKQIKALEARFKTEVPVGDWPVEPYGLLVKRWDQTGALLSDQVEENYPLDKFPEMYSDVFVGDVRELLPPEQNPDLYEKRPDSESIKNTVDDEEKKHLFKQVPYLKIVQEKK